MDVNNKIKIYLFDLDNTLCITKKKEDGNWDYLNSTPITNRIEYVNNLFDKGNKIIIETARGCVSKRNWYEETYKQLISFGLKFNELRTGVKYNFDYSIDDKGYNSEDYFFNEFYDVVEPCNQVKKINIFCGLNFDEIQKNLNQIVNILNKNIDNDYIDNLYLICNYESYVVNRDFFDNVFKTTINPNKKIKLLLDKKNKKFSFDNFIDLSNVLLLKDEISIFSNVDILYPEENIWENFNTDFSILKKNTNNILLSNKNLITNQSILNSDESWVFKTPIKIN